MNDDLKQRLRKVEGGNHYGATVWYKNPDGPEAADQIEKLETNFQLQLEWYLSNKRVLDDRIEKLEAVTKDDARWLAAYHKWCEMNGCAPSSSDLISARKALEGKDD